MDKAIQAGSLPALSASGEDIRLGPLEDCLGFLLRRAQACSFRTFKRHTGLQNLRPGWYAVLTIINENPGITPIDLSRASGRDKSTITPVLRDLSRERLISREPVPSDRRSYRMRLTQAGVERLAHLGACAEAHERELDAIIGLDSRDEFAAILRRIIIALD
jgi:DNA-binding MarR family transcriptional regulator